MATGLERRRTPGGWAQGAGTVVARERLDTWVANGRPVAAILVGLSRLDLLNAAHGREAGNAVLRAARERLAGVAAVERLSGGRFLLLAEADRDAAPAIASEAAAVLAQPYAGGMVIGSRVALVVAEPGEDGGALLGRLGEALAAARAAEAGAPLIAEPGRTASLDALAVDLHHAIAGDEIGILFQPQVRIADGAIVGAEALARWRHPRWGELGADELFAAAARADLGPPLSEHIQARALAAAAEWPAVLAGLRLSVNVTAGDVARPGFAAALLARVAASGFPADRLTLELTETGPVADHAGAAAALAALRAAGCRIAMDDFGAGYSSLSYLRTLPLDTVKLDKSLIEGATAGSRAARLVEAAVAMAQALGLAVVAEGVEDEAQRAVLAAAGCDLYQGYLCAPPLDAAAMAQLVGDDGCVH